MSPLSVSAVIPTFNGTAGIERALDSVLAQTHPVTEIVVVDDGSTDGTAELVRERYPQVRLIRQENAGASVARKVGVAACAGEFVASLDHDDEWLPPKLERQLAVFRACPGAALVTCPNLYVDVDQGGALGRTSLRPLPGGVVQTTFPDWLLRRGHNLANPCPSGWLVRRRVWEETGGFDRTWEDFSDWEYLLRLTAHGYPVLVLRERLYRYYAHRGSMSRCRDYWRRVPWRHAGLVRTYEPRPDDGNCDLVTRLQWETALKQILRRDLALLALAGDTAGARRMLREAAALRSSSPRMNLDVWLGNRFPGPYLKMRRRRAAKRY